MLQYMDDAIAETSGNPDMLEECIIVQESVFKLESKALANSMFTDGLILCDSGDEIFVQRVLFDTGALHHSYINEDIVNRNRDKWKDKFREVNVKVKLGDNNTCIEVKESVRVLLSLVDSNLKEHVRELDCYVWRMPGTGMIVGLPDILYNFVEFFQDLIVCGTKEVVNNLSNVSDECEVKDDIVFEGSKMEESQEEKDSYEPCSFALPLAHMNKSYGEALQEYYDLFSSSY
jgi:hypothetical protein